MKKKHQEQDKPVITAEYRRVIISIFIFSFVIAGVLFCAMSAPSLSEKGGLYSFIAGALCLLGALVMYIIKKHKKI